MEDTLINRIAIVVLAVALVIVSIVMAVSLKSNSNRLAGIEGLFVGQKETVTGGVAPVTLKETVIEQQEAIKKLEEETKE